MIIKKLKIGILPFIISPLFEVSAIQKTKNKESLYKKTVFNYSNQECNFRYQFYKYIIDQNYKELHNAWSNTCIEFEKMTKTRLVEGILDGTLTEEEFNNFLLPDLIYLKDLSNFLKNRSEKSLDKEIKKILTKRANIFISSYNKYKGQFEEIDNLEILKNNELIKNHFNYLESLRDEELIIALIPCMATFRGIGIYLDPYVKENDQWRSFVDRRKRDELKELLSEFSRDANSFLENKNINLENCIEILKKNIEFDKNFINDTMLSKINIRKNSKNINSLSSTKNKEINIFKR